jgi:hypothetical protein
VLGCLFGCADAARKPSNDAAASKPGQSAARTVAADDNQTFPAPHGPKVPADPHRIRDMLLEKFGRAARAVRVEVDTDNGEVRVQLRGEVPSAAIREAVMREVSDRVEGVQSEDYDLVVSGPAPLIGLLETEIESDFGARFSQDLRYGLATEVKTYAAHSRIPVLWDLWTGRPINELDLADLENDLHAVAAFSPDGKQLAMGLAHSEIVLWNLPQAHEYDILAKPRDVLISNDVAAVAYSPDSRTVASIRADKGEVWLWEIEGRKSRLLGTHPPDRSYLLAFSPGGKLLASTDDHAEAITLWDLASRTKRGVIPTGRIHLEVLAWAPDSRSLAAGRTTEEEGIVWLDLKGKALARFSPASGNSAGLIRNLVFSPDGKTLASRHEDAGVILWDLAAKKEWTRLDNAKVGSGRGLAFSPDGGVLAVACSQREPWGTGPPGFQFWDVSRRPGAAKSSGDFPPAGAKPLPERHDALARAIREKVLRTEGKDRVPELSVEILPGGAIHLEGRINSDYARENIERSVVIDFPLENRYRRTRTQRKLVSDLKVIEP